VTAAQAAGGAPTAEADGRPARRERGRDIRAAAGLTADDHGWAISERLHQISSATLDIRRVPPPRAPSSRAPRRIKARWGPPTARRTKYYELTRRGAWKSRSGRGAVERPPSPRCSKWNEARRRVLFDGVAFDEGPETEDPVSHQPPLRLHAFQARRDAPSPSRLIWIAAALCVCYFPAARAAPRGIGVALRTE